MSLVDEINNLPTTMINNFGKVRPFWLWVLPPYILLSSMYHGKYSDEEITAWINGRTLSTIINDLGITVDGYFDIWNSGSESPYRYEINNPALTLRIRQQHTTWVYTFWDSSTASDFQEYAPAGDNDLYILINDGSAESVKLLTDLNNFWTENATAPLTDYLIKRMIYRFRNNRGINSTRKGLYFQGR